MRRAQLTIVIQFFLMLNFLLAIVVEGYMNVRKDIAGPAACV